MRGCGWPGRADFFIEGAAISKRMFIRLLFFCSSFFGDEKGNQRTVERHLVLWKIIGHGQVMKIQSSSSFPLDLEFAP